MIYFQWPETGSSAGLTNAQLRASPVPVSLASSPLPTGAATEAKQDTGNASLASIDGKVLTNTQLRASAVPISAAALPLPSGAATEAKQDTGNSSLASIDGKVLTDTQLRASAVPVSAASLPLPSGAATEATLAAASAKLPAALGQSTMANSLSVAIASNQSTLPFNYPDTSASGTITTQNLVPAGTATAGSAVEIALAGHGTVAVQVTGTYTGALSAQATLNGTTWVTLNGLVNANSGAFAATIPSATQSVFQVECSGFSALRITALAAVTGTATLSLRATRSDGLISLDAPLPAGTNIIGALSANQSTNIAQMNGVAVLMGVGATGTGSQRVTKASVAGTITNTQATVGTSAVRATVAGTAPNAARVLLRIKPSINNTGRIFYGSSSVTTANGIEIVGPDTVVFEFDAGDYYLISDTAAQVVEILEKV